MFRSIGFFFLGILNLILFSALGIMMGLLTVSAWIRLEDTGMFVKWQLLDSPHKFQHLTYANQVEVVAQAEDGKYYLYYSGNCDGTINRKCGEWDDSPPDLQVDRFRRRFVEARCKSAYGYRSNDSDYTFYAKPRDLPQSESTANECAISLEFHPDGGVIVTYYVLLENGKVWKWIYKAIAMLNLGKVVIGVFVGLLMGIILWFRFQQF